MGNIISNYNSNNHKANFYKSLAIISIIFLWPEQIYIAHIQVSINYFLFPLVIIFFKTYLQDIITAGILTVLIYSLLFFQIFFGFSLATPVKTILYVPVFSFLIVYCFRFIKTIFKDRDEKKIYRLLRLFLKFQLSIQILQLILTYIGFGNIIPHMTSSLYINDGIPRASGLFYEPSNVGFSLSPFIYIIVQDYKKFIKWFHYDSIIVLIMIFFLSFSTTFVGVLLLSAGFKLLKSFRHINLKKTIIMASAILLIIYISMANHSIYIRINQVFLKLRGQEMISRNINMSSAVFLKGFEMAKLALEQYPLGVGIQNMQVLNNHTKIGQLGGRFERANSNNGGSLLFKITAEFGYLGLATAIFAFLLLVKYTLKKEENSYDLLIGSFLFGFIATFIRGPSYTAGVPIIGLSILFWAFMDNLKKYAAPSYAKINKNRLNAGALEIISK